MGQNISFMYNHHQLIYSTKQYNTTVQDLAFLIHM